MTKVYGIVTMHLNIQNILEMEESQKKKNQGK